MLGALYATNIAGFSPFGMEGWRVAFRTVAVAAYVIGAVVLYFVKDPRHPKKPSTENFPPASQPVQDNRDGLLAREVQDDSWQEVVEDFWAV